MTPTWRSTLVGALLILFAGVRIWHRHDAMFDPETIGMVSAGGALILGTDKLLGR